MPKDLEKRFLSVDTTVNIKGILVCMVLLSHLHGRVSLFLNSLFGTAFTAFGYLAVGVFFFLSGYGLYASMERKPGYLKNFPGQRLLPFYAQYLFLCVVYLIYTVATQAELPGGVRLVKSLLFGDTVVENGWYLQAQLLLYIAFYFSFRFSPKPITGVTIFVVIYCVVCPIVGLSTTWYETVPCFVLGLLIAHKKEFLVSILQKKKLVLIGLALAVGAFFATLLFGNKTIFPDPIRIVIKMLSAGLFVAVVTTLVAVIPIENPVTAFLGKHSLELYALQGIFIKSFRPIIHNDWLYMLAVVCALIPTAIVARLALSWIHSQTVKLTKKCTERT